MADPVFYDHEVVQSAPHDYVEVQVSPSDILKAWRLSMFAHELLNKTGNIKPETDMAASTLDKYLKAYEALKRGEEIAKPVIGIGIMDNLEIGIGREIIAAACNLGLGAIPVHMRSQQADEIQKLLK